jgi:hypothetical protein
MKLKYEGNTRDIQALLFRKKFYLLLRQESIKTDSYDFPLIVFRQIEKQKTLAKLTTLFVNKLPAVKCCYLMLRTPE